MIQNYHRDVACVRGTITFRQGLPPPITAPSCRPEYETSFIFNSMLTSIVWCTTIPPAIRHLSQADIQMTQEIVSVARPLGIAVHDHLIVGKDGHASFKGLRLI